MRKIGIFTAYQPHVKLGQDGIGRLMLYIMKGMLQNGDMVTVLAPSWHKKEVYELLKEHRLETTVKIKTVRWHAPVLLLIYDALLWYKLRPKKQLKKSFDFKELIMRLVFAALASYSFLLFFIQAVVIAVLAMIAFPIWGAILLFRKILSIEIPVIPGGVKRYLSFIPRSLRTDAWALGILNAARADELKKMVRFVNKGEIDLWYVPSIFWLEALKIKKKRVMAVPDLVYADFPELYYVDPVMQWSSRNLDLLLEENPKLVCYSNYVATRQLSELRNIKRKNITVIPHGNVDLSEYLQMGLPAKEMLDVYLRNFGYTVPDIEYVREYNFAEGNFLLYTSQHRYHKNIVGLLRILALLLQREHLNVKLVLTCAVYESLLPILDEMNLEREVIFLPRVPESILAALNHLAVLHVNPSLFEGGFPFTFSEAYSVGTPSLMADIPVTREYVDDDLAHRMLFDPYNPEDAVEKIKWALANRNELKELEKPLFDQFAQRTWNIVAEEYVQAMRYSCKHDIPTRKKKAWKRS